VVVLLVLSLVSASAETAAHNADGGDGGELNPVFDQYAALITSAQHRPLLHYSLQTVSVLCAKLSTVATRILDPGLCHLRPHLRAVQHPSLCEGWLTGMCCSTGPGVLMQKFSSPENATKVLANLVHVTGAHIDALDAQGKHDLFRFNYTAAMTPPFVQGALDFTQVRSLSRSC